MHLARDPADADRNPAERVRARPGQYSELGERIDSDAEGATSMTAWAIADRSPAGVSRVSSKTQAKFPTKPEQSTEKVVA